MVNFDPIAIIQSLLIPAVGWVVALANRVAGMVHKLEERIARLEVRQERDDVWKDAQQKQLDEHINVSNERFRDIRADMREQKKHE